MKVCPQCKGKNVTQQLCVQLDVNLESFTLEDIHKSCEWDDWYFCEDCEDECFGTVDVD